MGATLLKLGDQPMASAIAQVTKVCNGGTKICVQKIVAVTRPPPSRWLRRWLYVCVQLFNAEIGFASGGERHFSRSAMVGEVSTYQLQARHNPVRNRARVQVNGCSM
jgi:hypothetical protein